MTKTHVAWSGTRNLPDVCSPVGNSDLVLLVTGDGLLTAYDTQSGAVLWEKRVGDEFSASPVLAGDTVYLSSMKGRTYVFPLARKIPEPVAVDLGEPVFASPAFGDGCIYMRGKEHLFCIGE